MKAICAGLSFLIAWYALAPHHTHYQLEPSPAAITHP